MYSFKCKEKRQTHKIESNKTNFLINIFKREKIKNKNKILFY